MSRNDFYPWQCPILHQQSICSDLHIHSFEFIDAITWTDQLDIESNTDPFGNRDRKLTNSVAMSAWEYCYRAYLWTITSIEFVGIHLIRLPNRLSQCFTLKNIGFPFLAFPNYADAGESAAVHTFLVNLKDLVTVQTDLLFSRPVYNYALLTHRLDLVLVALLCRLKFIVPVSF